jgi:hypothetical protein
MKVIPLDADPHAAVRALLPWYATGRLDADELAQVDSHLAACPKCRDELAFERRMLAAQPAADTCDVDRGWVAMRKLIKASARAGQPRVPWPRRGTGWRMHWVVGAQFAAIAVLLAVIVLPRAGPGVYRALGNPTAAVPPNAMVMFKPGATEEEIRAALRASGARIVDGPTAGNAYLLRIARETPAVEAVARLRAQPAVALAESLEARPVP